MHYPWEQKICHKCEISPNRPIIEPFDPILKFVTEMAQSVVALSPIAVEFDKEL